VLDNYATHKTPEVRAWLEKHPRFKLHFKQTTIRAEMRAPELQPHPAVEIHPITPLPPGDP
jgi:hypothetical protein